MLLWNERPEAGTAAYCCAPRGLPRWGCSAPDGRLTAPTTNYKPACHTSVNIYESGERKKKLRFTGLGGFSCYSGLSKSQPSALCAVAILEGIRQLLVDVKVGWPACLQEGSKILCCIITYRNCAYFINTGFWWDPEQEWRCLKAPLFKGMCVCWPLKWRTGEVVGYFRRAMGQGVDISRCPIPQCH